MTRNHLITGQKIAPAKLEQARTLRRNMTPAEKCLWAALRRNQLDGFHFRRQQIIDGFIVDFYCLAAGLAVEVDGPVHEKRKKYDAERDRALANHNLRILRFQNEEIMHNLDDVLQRIRTTCHAGADPHPNPPPMRGRESAPPPRAGEGLGGRSNSPPLRGVGAGERPEEGSP